MTLVEVYSAHLKMRIIKRKLMSLPYESVATFVGSVFWIALYG
jgi:hypothetical protein